MPGPPGQALSPGQPITQGQAPPSGPPIARGQPIAPGQPPLPRQFAPPGVGAPQGPASPSGQFAPINQATTNQAPTNQTPINQTPTNQTPTNQTPINQTPINQAPANQAPRGGQGQAPFPGQLREGGAVGRHSRGLQRRDWGQHGIGTPDQGAPPAVPGQLATHGLPAAAPAAQPGGASYPGLPLPGGPDANASSETVRNRPVRRSIGSSGASRAVVPLPTETQPDEESADTRGVPAEDGEDQSEATPRSSAPRRHGHKPGSGVSAASLTGTGPPNRGGKRPKRGRRRRPTFWRELPMLVVVALLLTFLIQTFLARVYEIPSGSMEKTLHGCTGCTNDRVLVDKLSYRFGDPSPGDAVVFAGPQNWENSDFQVRRSGNALVRGLQTAGSLIGLAPPDEKDLIKRVIAIGGQTVACCDAQNRVTVDGKPLNEPYIYYLPEAGPPLQTEFGPVKVPDDQLWVMGDSRNNSADSRVPGHGPIPVANVIGKARFVVLPFNRVKSIDDTNPQRVALSMAGAPNGAPLALGVLGAIPLVAGRRWSRQWSKRGRRGRPPGSDQVG